MCTFVLAVLPESADPEQVESVAGELRPKLAEVSNPHLAAQLRPGERVFTTNAGSCDCGTDLGRAREGATAGDAVSDREVAKKRRKGWSQSRIERWLADKRRGVETRERSRRFEADHGMTREASMWLEWLRAVVSGGSSPWIGVLIHEFGGALGTERWELGEAVEHPIAAADETTLRTLAHDRVHRFRG